MAVSIIVMLVSLNSIGKFLMTHLIK
jgi:hypothetical protein